MAARHLVAARHRINFGQAQGLFGQAQGLLFGQAQGLLFGQAQGLPLRFSYWLRWSVVPPLPDQPTIRWGPPARIS